MAGPVAFVTEIIAPHRIAAFNALADRLGDRLRFIFINESESRRSWPVYRDEIRFDYSVLGGFTWTVPLRGDRQPVYLAPPLLPRLLRGDYETVVVGGWSHLEAYWSLAYAGLWRRRLVLWSETPLLGSTPQRPLRDAVKRTIVGGSSAYVVPGASAGRYLRRLGADRERLYWAPNAVDADFWASGPSPSSDRTTLLYIGRLVPRKGVALALRAFARSRLAGWMEFVVAGDGPERTRLEAEAPEGVRFVGDVDRDRLRDLLAHACALVVPSEHEVWGLVVNEAAAAGVPSVVSDGVGAARDFVVDERSGLVVPAGDVVALTAAFDRLAADPELARRLGQGARERSAEFSPERWAEGMAAAIDGTADAMSATVRA